MLESGANFLYVKQIQFFNMAKKLFHQSRFSFSSSTDFHKNCLFWFVWIIFDPVHHQTVHLFTRLFPWPGVQLKTLNIIPYEASSKSLSKFTISGIEIVRLRIEIKWKTRIGCFFHRIEKRKTNRCIYILSSMSNI